LREFAVDRFVPETEPDPLADALEDEEDEKDEEAREVDARVELAARAVKGATELLEDAEADEIDRPKGTTSHHSISATVRPEVLRPL
jgi:hypothetical protein